MREVVVCWIGLVLFNYILQRLGFKGRRTAVSAGGYLIPFLFAALGEARAIGGEPGHTKDLLDKLSAKADLTNE